MGDIIVCGDLNARIGNNVDYTEADSVAHIPVNGNWYDIDVAVNKRISQDSIVDTRGKDLLDICIGNKLRIVNGRTLGDSIGKYTCYKPIGCSVIDYFIVSENLLNQVLYMSVSDFLTDYSDCHCMLTLKRLASFQKESINKNLKELPCRYAWTESSSIHFQNSFTHPLVKTELDNFLSTAIHLNEKGIDNATEAIDKIIRIAADFGLKKKRPKDKFRQQNKHWFDFELKIKKKDVYNKARLMSMIPNDPQVRGSYCESYKVYAKLRKYKKRKFRQSILEKLDQLQTNNPKEYCTLVNSLRKKFNDRSEKV